MRVLVEEVVLGRPRVLETCSIGDLDVFQLVLQRFVLGAHPPIPPMLRVVHIREDPEFHLSPLPLSGHPTDKSSVMVAAPELSHSAFELSLPQQTVAVASLIVPGERLRSGADAACTSL